RRICHESRNSPELSYDYGRDDRRDRVPDPLHLGQGRRQAEPRHRLQVAPGLDRRFAAKPPPPRPSVPGSGGGFRLPQEGLRGSDLSLPAQTYKNAPIGRGVFYWVFTCRVIRGWSEGPDPESRDSGFDATHRPGMTMERSSTLLLERRLQAVELRHQR